MSQKTGFENLHVYQLAQQISDSAWAVIHEWKHFERVTIGKQLFRSADSVGANIAEGYGRGSLKYNIRFVKIARVSLFEVKNWLRRAYKLNLLSESEMDHFQEKLKVLMPKISAYINALDKKL